MRTTRLIAGCFLFFTCFHLATCHGRQASDSAFQGNSYSSEGCNVERGCFLTDMDMNVAWEPDTQNNLEKFTLWGSVGDNTGYVAMGISKDSDMESSDVYACVANGGVLDLKRYWNIATGMDAVPRTLIGASIIENNIVDGQIQCQFYRNMSLDNGDPEFFDISGDVPYHVLLARGTNLDGAGDVQYHNARSASNAVILSQAFSAAEGEEPLIKVHGCLMVIAWIGFASIGITMARYFKPMWPDSKLGGVKVWFAVHRAFMILALILFVVAFIIIFVHVEGFVELASTTDSKRRFAHAILGVIVTFLGILNPIMALFRPHPDTPKRPLFNWAHWAVGMSGFVLAAVTVALALVPIVDQTILPGLESYTFWVFIAFLAFFVIIWLILEILRFTTDSAGRTNDIPLGGKGETVQPVQDDSQDGSTQELFSPQNDPQGSVIKNILLFIYCVGVVFFVLFMVINMAVA